MTCSLNVRNCQLIVWGYTTNCQLREFAEPYLVGGFWPPLWKIWVRQLGWLEIPNINGKIKFMATIHHPPDDLFSEFSINSCWLFQIFEDVVILCSKKNPSSHPSMDGSWGTGQWGNHLRDWSHWEIFLWRQRDESFKATGYQVVIVIMPCLWMFIILLLLRYGNSIWIWESPSTLAFPQHKVLPPKLWMDYNPH